MALSEFEKITKKIYDGWLETQQGSFLGDANTSFDSLTNACIEYLKFKGYKVVEPTKPKYNIKKLDDLIHLFYAFSDNRHPELMNNYRHIDRDRKIASALVRSRREATGYGMKVAMNECGEIIETIFEHEKEFNFTIPITFGILGQKNCGWITDKSIQIMNRKRLKAAEEKKVEYIAKLDEKYDAEPDGFGDLDEILENLKD